MEKKRMENKMQDSKRDISQILVDFGIYNQSGIASMRLDKELREYFASEISKAREEVLLELLEKKTNYKIEKVGHGYKVTQEYVLVSDIEKELSKLSNK